MLLLAAYVLGAFQTPTDAFTRFNERLAHAETIFGTLLQGLGVSGKQPSSEIKFWYKRPNFFRAEVSTAGKPTSLYVGDGKNVWIYDPVAGRLEQQASAATGYLFHISFLEPFVDGASGNWTDPLSISRGTSSGGQQVINYQLKSHRGSSVMELVMDAKTELPLEFTLVSGKTGSRALSAFKALKIDSGIDPGIFKYVPKVQPNAPDETVGMLKIGSKAPQFTGRMLGGISRLS